MERVMYEIIVLSINSNHHSTRSHAHAHGDVRSVPVIPEHGKLPVNLRVHLLRSNAQFTVLCHHRVLVVVRQCQNQLGVVQSDLMRDALHLAVVNQADLAVAAEQDVAGVRITVENAVHKDFIRVHLTPHIKTQTWTQAHDAT